jgi:hypothetical protein
MNQKLSREYERRFEAERQQLKEEAEKARMPDNDKAQAVSSEDEKSCRP